LKPATKKKTVKGRKRGQNYLIIVLTRFSPWGTPTTTIPSTLAEKAKTNKPVRLWIALGQGVSQDFSIETRAQNRRDSYRDNNRGLPGKGGVDLLNDPDSPSDRILNLNFPAGELRKKLNAHLTESPFPVNLSNDPGCFICNETLYQLIESKTFEKAAGRDFDGIFIHVPRRLDWSKPSQKRAADQFAEKVVGSALEAIDAKVAK